MILAFFCGVLPRTKKTEFGYPSPITNPNQSTKLAHTNCIASRFFWIFSFLKSLDDTKKVLTFVILVNGELIVKLDTLTLNSMISWKKVILYTGILMRKLYIRDIFLHLWRITQRNEFLLIHNFSIELNFFTRDWRYLAHVFSINV